MASWGDFAIAAPELATLGAERFRGARVAYLATVGADGTPRVHPVTPILTGEALYVFMEPTSPKGHDLRRNGRYAMHSLVTDPDGGGGEFSVRGHAHPVDDPDTRSTAAEAASYDPQAGYVLFELAVEEALSTVYEGGQPVRTR